MKAAERWEGSYIYLVMCRAGNEDVTRLKWLPDESGAGVKGQKGVVTFRTCFFLFMLIIGIGIRFLSYFQLMNRNANFSSTALKDLNKGWNVSLSNCKILSSLLSNYVLFLGFDSCLFSLVYIISVLWVVKHSNILEMFLAGFNLHIFSQFRIWCMGVLQKVSAVKENVSIKKKFKRKNI